MQNNISVLKRKMSPKAKYDIDLLINNNFSVENSMLNKNIGRIVVYHKGTPRERLVEIVGVQRVWDYNNKGEYVPNCLGYTVKDVQKSVIINGEEYELDDHWWATSTKDIFFE